MAVLFRAKERGQARLPDPELIIVETLDFVERLHL
jgi:hypothetical protein